MDRPILFSASMVRSILKEIATPGTGKTQTRRIAKWRNIETGLNLGFSGLRAIRDRCDGTPDGVWILEGQTRNHWVERARLRTYHPGDRLWVKETWAPWGNHEGISGIDYRASGTCNDVNRGWRPSIFMPREVSRITLTVTKVRVQRLKDIDEPDAYAEGVVDWVEENDPHRWGLASPSDRIAFVRVRYGSCVKAYSHLWDTINEPKQGEATGPRSWHANPWVVAVTFTPDLRNIDAPSAGKRAEAAA